jgi:hypothetical protein
MSGKKYFTKLVTISCGPNNDELNWNEHGKGIFMIKADLPANNVTVCKYV